MVVKFFGNKKGGSTASINYLLNEREKQGTAKVLKGDPSLTKEIINSIQYKQKVTVGCLVFEEKDLSQDLKHKIMEDFEKHLLPNFEDRYNIIWVEHTDKNNLELNFVIPKIDLESKKSLNPYFHKADMKRIDLWQSMTNLEHNFTNPKDPAKKRTVEIDTKQINLSRDYANLDEKLHSLIAQGKITNRKQMIELLENSNIKVTRQNKDGLSIKLPDSKRAKRFKGDIYNEQFTSLAGLRESSNRARTEIEQYNKRDTSQELRELREQLEKYTRDKAEKLNSKYKTRQNSNINIKHNDRNNDLNNDISIHKKKLDREREYSETREQQIHNPRQQKNDKKRKNYILQTSTGVEINDSLRDRIIRGIKENTRFQSRDFRQLQEHSIQHIRATRELSTRVQGTTKGVRNAEGRAIKYFRAINSLKQAVKQIRELVNKRLKKAVSYARRSFLHR